jgi:nucleotide-binding universal stress UspA family protein
MVEFDQILVPIDGSEGSHRAALFGARLATTHGCALKLAYVVPLTPESVMAMAKLSREEVQAKENLAARAILETAERVLGEAGVDLKPEQLVMIGDAAAEILNFIKKQPAALVVMGRRGLSPIEGLLVGSVSDKVMRHARGAVTLVN